jgi:hypothetical protein
MMAVNWRKILWNLWVAVLVVLIYAMVFGLLLTAVTTMLFPLGADNRLHPAVFWIVWPVLVIGTGFFVYSLFWDWEET